MSGDTGIGLATSSYKLRVTPCLHTLRRLTIICLICPATVELWPSGFGRRIISRAFASGTAQRLGAILDHGPRTAVSFGGAAIAHFLKCIEIGNDFIPTPSAQLSQHWILFLGVLRNLPQQPVADDLVVARGEKKRHKPPREDAPQFFSHEELTTHLLPLRSAQ